MANSQLRILFSDLVPAGSSVAIGILERNSGALAISTVETFINGPRPSSGLVSLDGIETVTFLVRAFGNAYREDFLSHPSIKDVYWNAGLIVFLLEEGYDFGVVSVPNGVTYEIINDGTPVEPGEPTPTPPTNDYELILVTQETDLASPCYSYLNRFQTTNPTVEVQVAGKRIATNVGTNFTLINPRDLSFSYTLWDADGNRVVYSGLNIPSLKNEDLDIKISLTVTGADIVLSTPHNGLLLGLEYAIDGAVWQSSGIFKGLSVGTYLAIVRDKYGCTQQRNFTIEQRDILSVEIEKLQNESLHELNVGKHLNLFNKQRTMKLGFIVNQDPSSVKIFKHIAMTLNTEYAVKGICIKTSLKQERLVNKCHPVYRIREGMHSVPLKNVDDWDDLRGSWSYVEIEIESIDDQKVDLFSVIMYIRKSII